MQVHHFTFIALYWSYSRTLLPNVVKVKDISDEDTVCFSQPASPSAFLQFASLCRKCADAARLQKSGK